MFDHVWTMCALDKPSSNENNDLCQLDSSSSYPTKPLTFVECCTRVTKMHQVLGSVPEWVQYIRSVSVPHESGLQCEAIEEFVFAQSWEKAMRRGSELVLVMEMMVEAAPVEGLLENHVWIPGMESCFAWRHRIGWLC